MKSCPRRKGSDSSCPQTLTVPSVGKRSSVPPELLGKRLRCLKCQSVFTVETGAAVPASEVPEVDISRIKQTDYGVPGYLWLMAALPWGLLVLALGGCIWGVSAGMAAVVLFAVGISVVKSRQLSVGIRLAGLFVLDGLVGFLLIVGGTVCVITLPSEPGWTTAADASSSVDPRRPKPPSTIAGLPPGSPLFTKGPRIYLAELQEFNVQSGPWNFTKNGAVEDGRPIRFNKTHSRHGLSMHPPSAPGVAKVNYQLAKQAALLRAVVAINDTSNTCASPAIFTVLGDGTQLWQSKRIAPDYALWQECSVNVSGIDVLELRVHCENRNRGRSRHLD